MTDYFKIATLEDDMLRLTVKYCNYIQVVNKTDITINSHTQYNYTGLNIEILQPNVIVLFSPNPPSDFKYFITAQDINEENNQVKLYMYNTTLNNLVIPAGTTLGYFWVVIPATLTEPDEEPGYYVSDLLFIKELQPKVIYDSKYIIDENGNHKLEFRLNRLIYDGKEGTKIPLKDLK